MMPSEHDVIEQYLLVYDRARGVQVSAEPVGTDAASACALKKGPPGTPKKTTRPRHHKSGNLKA